MPREIKSMKYAKIAYAGLKGVMGLRKFFKDSAKLKLETQVSGHKQQIINNYAQAGGDLTKLESLEPAIEAEAKTIAKTGKSSDLTAKIMTAGTTP